MASRALIDDVIKNWGHFIPFFIQTMGVFQKVRVDETCNLSARAADA